MYIIYFYSFSLLIFQDVLLYNFFGSSPLRNHWRVTYNYMKELDLLDSNLLRFPAFDKYKHNLLSSELKQLYVAITRTRQRLWICESVNDFSRPMFDYWMKVGVIQVRHLDESLAQAMRVVSSADEWRMRGIKVDFVNKTLHFFVFLKHLLSFFLHSL